MHCSFLTLMLTSLRRPIETLYFSVDPHHIEMSPACCTCRPFTSKVSAFPEPDVACQFHCDLENRDSIQPAIMRLASLLSSSLTGLSTYRLDKL